MKLYLVRHGQSAVQSLGVHQSIDVTLSKMGRDQAKLVASRLKNKEINVIFSSPFPRAKETADIIAQVLDKKVVIRDELKEAIWPSEIIGLHHSAPESEKIRSELEKNAHDPDFKYSDEESFNELVKRSKRFLDHLIRKYKDKNVLCVSHGFIQKITVGIIVFEEEFSSNIYNKFKRNSWMENTGITEVEHTDENGWTLHTWNDKTHL